MNEYITLLSYYPGFQQMFDIMELLRIIYHMSKRPNKKGVQILSLVSYHLFKKHIGAIVLFESFISTLRE